VYCLAYSSFAGAERSSRIPQSRLHLHHVRVRAAEQAPRGPYCLLDKFHGLASIVERGAGVQGDDAAPGFRDGASATAAGCALVVALWAWIAGSDPSTVAARAVATLIVAALAARLRAAPPTASVEACFYAVHESPQGAECASPMVYRRAARLAADARAASGPRGVQRGLLISPRRGPSESEDHADHEDSPERATTTTRDGLTLL
jgi:hypothetical protein